MKLGDQSNSSAGFGLGVSKANTGKVSPGGKAGESQKTTDFFGGAGGMHNSQLFKSKTALNTPPVFGGKSVTNLFGKPEGPTGLPS